MGVPHPEATCYFAFKLLEEVRFAVVNDLCVELDYQDSDHLIEPYIQSGTDPLWSTHPLCRGVPTRAEIGSYNVSQTQSVRVSTEPFTSQICSGCYG